MDIRFAYDILLVVGFVYVVLYVCGSLYDGL